MQVEDVYYLGVVFHLKIFLPGQKSSTIALHIDDKILKSVVIRSFEPSPHVFLNDRSRLIPAQFIGASVQNPEKLKPKRLTPPIYLLAKNPLPYR